MKQTRTCLEEGQLARLRLLSEALKRPMAALVREAIDAVLQRHDPVPPPEPGPPLPS